MPSCTRSSGSLHALLHGGAAVVAVAEAHILAALDFAGRSGPIRHPADNRAVDRAVAVLVLEELAVAC